MHCAVDAPSPQPGCFAEISTKGRFVSLAWVAVITDCQSPELRRSHHDYLGGFGRCEALAAIANPTGTRQSASSPC